MTITEIRNKLADYILELQSQEKAEKTIKAYKTDIEMFIQYLDENAVSEIDKETVIDYKESLKATKSIATTNRKIVSLNKFFEYCDVNMSVKSEKVTEDKLSNLLTKAEYKRLLAMAKEPTDFAREHGLKPDAQLHMIMMTLANTGIRIGELEYFTVESVTAAKKTGSVKVTNKGKTREVQIPKDLQKLLKAYCNEKGIKTGYIFGTRNGTPISNEQITRRMKNLAGYCRMSKDKVHPHNFRHLFAQDYIERFGRIDELARILGHSNINTTKIYTETTMKEISNKYSLI